jgi:OOP family OmpA-OmpF porin
MKRAILILLFLGVIIQFSEAQLWKLKRIELTGGIGTTTFFGDVGGYSHGDNWAGLKDITFLQTRFNANFSAKYRITQNLNVRASFTYGLIHATDERGSNQGRGFEVFTRIFEPALLGEYYFIKNSAENSYLFNKGRGSGFIGFLRSIDFYAFTGIGGLYYTLEPNDLLAPKVPFTSDFTAVVPLGVGGNVSAYPNINFGFELGFRYAFSDYLDGYSNPQYSRANDVYYFFDFTVTYRLKLHKNVLSSFRRR